MFTEKRFVVLSANVGNIADAAIGQIASLIIGVHR